MAIYKGNKKVVAVYKGSTPINKIYKGSTLVFQKGGGSQSVSFVITFTDDSDPSKRRYKPLCEGTTKTATSQTIELPSEGETYKFVNPDTLLKVRNYSNNCPSVTSFSYLFYNAYYMKALTFAKGIDTSKIKSFNNMFDSCSSLGSLDLSSFNTANAETMDYMFGNCSSLVSLDVSSFNTANAETMDYMFSYCRSLVSLDVSNFDTSKCTSFTGMFTDCYVLGSLDLSNFDTSKCTNFYGMFYRCNRLNHIKCKQSFKDWCITNQDTIKLPTAMREGGSGTWEIIN